MTNKHILIFAPLKVFPVEMANQQDIYFRIKIFLELGYKVTLIEYKENLEETVVEDDVNVIKVAKTNNFKADKDKIINLCKELNPDIFWFEYLKSMKVAREISSSFPKKKIYFRNHNLESAHYYEKALYSIFKDGNLKIILIFFYTYFKIKKMEKEMAKISDQIFFISKLDQNLFEKKYFSNKATYLPFYKKYDFVYRNKNDLNLNIFYFGSNFNNSVNLSGLLFIYNKLIPKLKKEKIKFHILGRNCPQHFKAENLSPTGFIDDIDTFLDKMDISIIPVKIGYGMKIKAYESLKRGFPTIVSKRVHDVFGGEDNKHYLVAEKPEQWIKKIMLLKDNNFRKQLSLGASKFMKDNFNINVIKDALKDL
ncbi:hypothetical protein C0584_01750 [Candidatus Parcubacteria bacterium]|nr:MAG: hypothetical protein C0584_01750 [Candidatus Parcubacteria bacterium]